MATCARCDGSGTIECPQCEGRGEIDNPLAIAGVDDVLYAFDQDNKPDKEIECPKCEGTCEITCPTCDGSGEVDDDQDEDDD